MKGSKDSIEFRKKEKSVDHFVNEVSLSDEGNSQGFARKLPPRSQAETMNDRGY